MFFPFAEYRPDVDDFNGDHTQVLFGVLPRGDGYGPFANLNPYTLALPAACRGFCYARKTDGTIVIFAGTVNQIYRLDNTTLDWVPVSKVTALTSISNGTPAVFTLNSHGRSNGDRLVLSTSNTLPTGLTVGTVYYVVNRATDTFNVSLTSGGTAVNTSGAGSGTHSMTYFYTDLASTDQWQFDQFGNNVVAVNSNTVSQVYDVSSSSAFSNLAGSPPTARYAAVVGRFQFLSGLTSTPLRVQWSDIDGITTWTAGTGFSNYVDLPDGGIVRGVAGGEFGLIFQESVIRRFTYVPGATPAFQIERITEDIGLLGPFSIIRAGGRVFFVSQQGFHEYSSAGLRNIGKERVDRTFLADIDLSNLQLLVGASDPASTRVWWAYRSTSASSATFQKIIIYDYALERWSPPISITGEYLTAIVKPGMTLESVDTLVGSNLDLLTSSLDAIQSALSSRMAAFDANHKLGFFDGPNVEAIVETSERSVSGKRVRVRGLEPRTDAATVYGSLRYRANAQSILAQTSETPVNAQGICPQNIDTKLARARMRIPAGTLWTNVMGAEPDFVEAGKR